MRTTFSQVLVRPTTSIACQTPRYSQTCKKRTRAVGNNSRMSSIPKNHLLVQDDDDDNEDDIELVNSILSNTNDENLEDGEIIIVNSIDPSGFLP